MRGASNTRKPAVPSDLLVVFTMDHTISSVQALYLGCQVIPLVFVEVTPLKIAHEAPNDQLAPALSAPLVKMLLRKKTLVSNISEHGSVKMMSNSNALGGKDSSGGLMRQLLWFPRNDSSDLSWARLHNSNQLVPVALLPSEDPTVIEQVPCWILGYFIHEFIESGTMEAIITDSTDRKSVV